MNTSPQLQLSPLQIAFQKGKAASKAKLKAHLAKGTTKAKTATTPAGKQKIAAKIKEDRKTKSRLSTPGELARCRAIVGGDLHAGVLVYRMAYLYRTINPKLKRNGYEYIAVSRNELSMSAGLSISELKNRALPLVKKYAGDFVQIEAWGRGADKKLWYRIDLDGYREALNDGGYELKIKSAEGLETYPKSPKI